MVRTICECGWGKSKGGGELSDFLGHVRGFHKIQVCLGSSHYAHCNDDSCCRQNGHGRRIHSFELLVEHLSDRHCLECCVV